jgi:hypothetical protein
LDVRDKHQELILQRSLASASGPILDFQPEDGSGVKILHGTETKSVKLTFPHDCALADQELISTLHDLVEVTTSVVKAFEALVVPTGQAPVSGNV